MSFPHLSDMITNLENATYAIQATFRQPGKCAEKVQSMFPLIKNLQEKGTDAEKKFYTLSNEHQSLKRRLESQSKTIFTLNKRIKILEDNLKDPFEDDLVGVSEAMDIIENENTKKEETTKEDSDKQGLTTAKDKSTEDESKQDGATQHESTEAGSAQEGPSQAGSTQPGSTKDDDSTKDQSSKDDSNKTKKNKHQN